MALQISTTFERDWDEPDDPTPVQMAVVGLGWFGADVAIPAIAESEYCTLGAVVSGSAEKAERIGDEWGATPLTYDEYHDGVGRDAYDAVYVVTPNALHLPYVETAAEYDKPILCEKPLEATAERTEELVAACESAEVPLMTAYRMQTTRSVRWVRSLVRDGVIGDPVHVNGEFSFRILADGGDPDQWRLDADLAGGGALMDIGVYPMNTSRFVLGADPTAVAGAWYATRGPFEGVDEHVSFQLEYPGAVSASCSASFGAWSASRFAVLGTDGRIVIEDPFGVDADRRLTVDVGGHETTLAVDEPNEMVEEFDFFASRLLRDEPIGPDARHGLFDVKIAEAVYESGNTGRQISLQD